MLWRFLGQFKLDERENNFRACDVDLNALRRLDYAIQCSMMREVMDCIIVGRVKIFHRRPDTDELFQNCAVAQLFTIMYIVHTTAPCDG